MPVIASDLLAENGGQIEPSFQFAGEGEADLLTRLGKYLDAGYAFTVASGREDAAATAWAYYMAYTAQVTRMASRPATLSVEGEASRTYTGAQIEALQGMAAAFLAEFNGYAPDESTTDVLATWPVHFSARR